MLLPIAIAGEAREVRFEVEATALGALLRWLLLVLEWRVSALALYGSFVYVETLSPGEMPEPDFFGPLWDPSKELAFTVLAGGIHLLRR